MNCPRCSTPIPAGSRYCPNCGFYVDPAPGSTPHVDTSDLPVRKIGFGEAVHNFFAQYADFSGRATRSEYWYAILFTFLVDLAISMVCGLFFERLEVLASLIFALVTLVPGLAVSWRRLHDIGKSGGWYFISLIPLVGGIILLVFCCTGSDDDNEYGPRKV